MDLGKEGDGELGTLNGEDEFILGGLFGHQQKSSGGQD